MKKLVPIAFAVLFLILFSYNVQAVKIAMVVKNAASLSYEYEQKIKDILTYSGYNITLVDKTTAINYSDYDLIVVVGRPPNVSPLDNFVANIPVNDYPTVAIDSVYINAWGWATSVSTVFSNQAQSIYIFNTTHPITSGYNGTVIVHMASGEPLLGLGSTSTSSTFLATLNSLGNLGIITVADPNTTLLNGQTTKKGFVFFGISDSLYWTSETEGLFLNSVAWSIDSDKDGVHNVNDLCPNTPVNETINTNGCSCSQLSCDDGNSCTDDTCSAGVCSHTNNNLCQNYCNDSIRYYNETCDSVLNCSYTSEDCGSKDGWYNTTQWTNTTQCAEKEQVGGEQRDYSCDPSGCIYNVINTTWTDTGNTRTTCIDTGAGVINAEVDGSRDLTQNFTGLHTVDFLDSSNNTLVECSFNFSAQALDLSSISIKRNEDSVGSLVVKGLACYGTKTVYVDRLSNVNYLCIKDADIASISEITPSCNGANETLIACNATSTTANGYSCVLNATTNRYEVTGLNHSGVKEYTTCSDGIQDQGETGIDCGGPCSACQTSNSILSSSSGGYVPTRKIQSSGIPASLNLEKNKGYTFTVSVKNTGDVELYDVKINISFAPGWIGVAPKSEPMILVGEEKAFDVTITPSAVGDYNVSLKIFSSNIRLEEDKFAVKVFDSLSMPKLSIEASPLNLEAGVSNAVSIKIKNEGNATANGNLSLTVPDGWLLAPDVQAVSIGMEEKSFDFTVTPPLKAAGNYSIEAKVSYNEFDGTKTVSQSFQAEISEPPTAGGEKLSITGMIVGFIANGYDVMVDFVYVYNNYIILLVLATILISAGYSSFKLKNRKASSSVFIKSGQLSEGKVSLRSGQKIQKSRTSKKIRHKETAGQQKRELKNIKGQEKTTLSV